METTSSKVWLNKATPKEEAFWRKYFYKPITNWVDRNTEDTSWHNWTNTNDSVHILLISFNNFYLYWLTLSFNGICHIFNIDNNSLTDIMSILTTNLKKQKGSASSKELNLSSEQRNCSAYDYNRSTVKRLFSSVFSIVPHSTLRSTMTKKSVTSTSTTTHLK